LVTAQIVVEVDLSTETMEIWNPRSLPRRSFSPFDKIGGTARELQKKAPYARVGRPEERRRMALASEPRGLALVSNDAAVSTA